MLGKFRELSGKEKAEYIWDYYRWHIIGIFVAVFLLGWLINTIWLNPPKKPYLALAVYGSMVADEALIALENSLTSVLVPDDLKASFTAVTYCFYESGNPQIDMALIQKFNAIVMSNELDVLIAEPDAFDELVSGGFAINLDSVFDKGLIGEDEVYEAINQETGKLSFYGIKLPAEALKEYGLELKNPIFGIVANSERVESAINALNLFN